MRRHDEAGHLDPVAFGEGMVGVATFFSGVALFLRYIRKHVIRPLSWLHGVSEDDAADGESIPPLPMQMRQLRESNASITVTQTQQGDDIAAIMRRLERGEQRFDRMESNLATVEERSRQLEPNGGESLADKVGRGLAIAEETQGDFAEHLEHAANSEAALWEAIGTTSRRESDQIAAQRMAESARTRASRRRARS